MGENGVVVIIIATHVDDLVWACRPETEERITIIKSMLTLGAESEYSFRYSGKEIEKDKETFSIKVTCRATTEKLTPIDMPPGVSRVWPWRQTKKRRISL